MAPVIYVVGVLSIHLKELHTPPKNKIIVAPMIHFVRVKNGTMV